MKKILKFVMVTACALLIVRGVQMFVESLCERYVNRYIDAE